jgi:hypothetical protein
VSPREAIARAAKALAQAAARRAATRALAELARTAVFLASGGAAGQAARERLAQARRARHRTRASYKRFAAFLRAVALIGAGCPPGLMWPRDAAARRVLADFVHERGGVI